MKRILINRSLYGRGGGETHLLHLSAGLVENGAEVTLLSRYAHPDTPILQVCRSTPIRFIRTPFSKSRFFYRLSTAWALSFWPFLLGPEKYDLLYTWEISPFTKFLSRFISPRGHILLQRTGEPAAEKDTLKPSLEKLLSGMIVETPFQREAARRVFHLPIVDLPQIGHVKNVPPRRRRDRSENGVFRITFAGRYEVSKGIYRLLEIGSGLGIEPLEINFYGWGPEAERLKERIRDRALEKFVHVHGPYQTAEELQAILEGTDLLVLPSETEGLPVILLEAMAYGVPFVASDVGAVRFLSEDNPDVSVVPLDNPRLKAAIEEMAEGIRLGRISGSRLQDYSKAKCGTETLLRRWVDLLFHPEKTFNA